jgi:hypothetical protein
MLKGTSTGLGKIHIPAENIDKAVCDIRFIPGFVTVREEGNYA